MFLINNKKKEILIFKMQPLWLMELWHVSVIKNPKELAGFIQYFKHIDLNNQVAVKIL